MTLPPAYVGAGIPQSEKGAPFGVAPLDGAGDVPLENLPDSVKQDGKFRGTYPDPAALSGIPNPQDGDTAFVTSTGTSWAYLSSAWGDTGAGSIGDMLKAVYDPTAISGDAFARANHTGTQPASSISDFDAEVSNNPDVTANSAKVSADGSVTTHNDVTSAGSGEIITVAERAQIGQNAADIITQDGKNTGSVTVHSDVTDAGSGAIITAAERAQIGTNAANATGSVTVHSDVTDAGSGQIITAAERAAIARSELVRRTTSTIGVSGNTVINFAGGDDAALNPHVTRLSDSTYRLDAVGVYKVSFKANLRKQGVTFGGNRRFDGAIQLDTGGGFVDVLESYFQQLQYNDNSDEGMVTVWAIVRVTVANTWEIRCRVNGNGSDASVDSLGTDLLIEYKGNR